MLLTIADVVSVLRLTLEVEVTSMLETFKTEAASVQSRELFVIAPTALLVTGDEIFALAKVMSKVKIFGVIEVNLLWLLFNVLTTVHLARVIDERLSYVKSMTRAHSNTKAAHFY